LREKREGPGGKLKYTPKRGNPKLGKRERETIGLSPKTNLGNLLAEKSVIPSHIRKSKW